MNGLLIYDKAGAERNSWFIGRLTESAKARGCNLELIVIDSDFNTEKLSSLDPNPDFAIVRTISPSLSLSIETQGIPTFNNHLTSKVANDKMKTHYYATMMNVPTMATQGVGGIDMRLPTEYPKVIKSVDGHGGSEVFLVNNATECKEILSLHPNKRFIAQDLSSEPGVDMRVYVLGGKVLAAVKRTSDSDFRSNFSLGGKAELVPLPGELHHTVKILVSSLGADFVGIDFIRHNGEWVLNEIEDVVGTRMLYSLTDIDAADLYIDYVISKVNKLNK